MAKQKRGRKYIDKQIQGALVRRMFRHWLLFILSVCAVAIILQFVINPFQVAEEKFAYMRYIITIFAIVSAVHVPIFAYESIKLSHRFVGPMVRFRAATRDVIEGRTPRPVKLRTDDFWQEFAVDFNKMLAKLSAAESDERAPHS